MFAAGSLSCKFYGRTFFQMWSKLMPSSAPPQLPAHAFYRFSALASRSACLGPERRDYAPSSSGGSLPSQLAELAGPGWPPGSHPCDGALGCHGGGAPERNRSGRNQRRHASAAG